MTRGSFGLIMAVLAVLANLAFSWAICSRLEKFC